MSSSDKTRGMNQSQIRYARQRLERIYDKKIEDFIDSLPEVKDIPNEEKFRLIKSGKVRLKKDVTINPWGCGPGILDCFVFPEEDLIRKKRERLDSKREAYLKKLRVERTKIEDELVLGDCRVAMELLSKFENTRLKVVKA